MIILFVTIAVSGFLLLSGVMIIATLAERQEIAKGKASALMLPIDFAILIQAIDEGAPLWFKYTDRFGTYAQRRAVIPRGFFETPPTSTWPGKVYLWATHLLHGRREQYNVKRIFDARFIPRSIEAFVDPLDNAMYWDGTALSLETTVIP